ncbi:MAG: 2-isopropylmalate synthase [Candidatus Altiarchaeales archaeon]|nr:MAG: 2-isopropylmalate synthase [Candidatus Altiarchaeales archaeon]
MEKKKIKILDTTLRDGEQTPGVSLTPDEKLTIAKALDDIGVDIIEAGAAITSLGEQESIKKIANENLNAEIASYARILKGDIDAAIKCDVDSIFLVSPTSDLHIRYKLRTTRDKLISKTLDAIQYCKDHGLVVDLCTEDGSRTSVDFLIRLLKSATEYGIDRYTIADTVGVMTPEKIKDMFAKLKKEAKIPLGVHCHDDFGLATANTIAAVKGGAQVVDVVVNGLGERAGNASLEEVVMALKLLEDYETNINTKKISNLSELVEKLFGVPVPPNKAIVGENAFTHEAGIHVDGILKKPETYEAIKPELVGAKRRFVLGKHVGMKSVKKMLDELNISVNDEQLREIFEQIKYIGDKGKKVTSADLEAIAHSVLGIEIEKAIRVDELVAIAGNRFTPTASVKVRIDGKEIRASGIGTGPVDAAINAIRQATKDIPFELIEYHVDSISGGTDAVVEVMVKLRSKGKIITAKGAGTDIVLASVDALVNGLNLILRRIS